MQVVKNLKVRGNNLQFKIKAINETILFTDGVEDLEKTEAWRKAELKKLHTRYHKNKNKKSKRRR